MRDHGETWHDLIAWHQDRGLGERVDAARRRLARLWLIDGHRNDATPRGRYVLHKLEVVVDQLSAADVLDVMVQVRDVLRGNVSHRVGHGPPCKACDAARRLEDVILFLRSRGAGLF